jgi:2-dehydrotetronate isomerase
VLQFSANLGFLWPDRPLLARLEAAARAGFRAVEMHWPYDTSAAAVAQASTRFGLQLLGINTPVGDAAAGERGTGALSGREAEFQAGIDLAIDWCRKSGARAIHAMAGNVTVAERAHARAVFAANLRSAAARAAAHDLQLLLEPLNGADTPGYFYSTLAEAITLIEQLALPNVRLQFDVYHVARAEGDVLSKLRRYRDYIGNVQIAAVPSRTEPDEGEIDYRAIFQALQDLQLPCWIGCEYRPRADTDEGLTWLRHLGVSLS